MQVAEGEVLLRELMKFGGGGIIAAVVFYYARKDVAASQSARAAAEAECARKKVEIEEIHTRRIEELTEAHAHRLEELTTTHVQQLQQVNDMWADRMQNAYQQLNLIAVDYKDTLVSNTRAITALHQFLLSNALNDDEKEG